ncbi:MAG: hypothetical protein HY433_03040 [Candidatus Liptonbacteria bacterium]|nr:hypothetical protein [Candidatus Liptonbacteria bacterium]
MNIIDDLLIILGSYSGGYKLMRKRIRGYTGPAKFRNIREHLDAKDATISNTLYRLRKRGLVEQSNNLWHITKKGTEYLAERISAFKKYPRRKHDHTRPRKKEKNMVIAFDIPEKYRKRRDWLRTELNTLGFIPLQKSVWFGPAPLPKEFIDTLVEFNVTEFMKFFEAKEYEIV